MEILVKVDYVLDVMPHYAWIIIHLVDVVFDVNTIDAPGVFAIICYRKNRYGKVGEFIFTRWEHLDTGVIPYSVQNEYFLNDANNKNVERYDQGDRSFGAIAKEAFYEVFWFLKK